VPFGKFQVHPVPFQDRAALLVPSKKRVIPAAPAVLPVWVRNSRIEHVAPTASEPPEKLLSTEMAMGAAVVPEVNKKVPAAS
jgi:hypothetical protein